MTMTTQALPLIEARCTHAKCPKTHLVHTDGEAVELAMCPPSNIHRIWVKMRPGDAQVLERTQLKGA